jgi:hypothetical protein
MLNKPIEVPPQVAQAFLHDMRALLREDNTNKRDEIAARRPMRSANFVDRGSGSFDCQT